MQHNEYSVFNLLVLNDLYVSIPAMGYVVYFREFQIKITWRDKKNRVCCIIEKRYFSRLD